MNLTTEQSDRIRSEVREYVLGLFEIYSRRGEGIVDQVMDRFAEDIQGFGSGEHEIVSDLSEMRKIIEGDFAATPDGLKADVRIRTIRPLAVDHAAVLVFVDLKIPAGDGTVDMPLRYSMVVKQCEDGSWRMTQGHASVPDRDQAPDESVPLDAMRARAEKLERDVAERTAELAAANRELQIEAAVERVRSRSMAMRSSDELADLSLELVQQVQGLGVDTWFCAFNIYDDDPRGSIEWGSDGRGTIPHYRTPREGIFKRYFEAGQRGESLLINEIGEDECPAHYEWLCSLPGVGDILLEMKAEGIDFPTSQIDHVAFNRYGYLIFITYEPAPESHDIFRRFSNVFEQTYTRFLDLKKAEEQAREAEINLAVERVRARATAMRESTEIVDVADALRGQMQSLGLGTVNGCTIFLRAGGTRYRVSEMSRPDESDGAGLAFDIEFEPDELGEDTHVHEILAADDYTVLYFDSDRLLAAADLAALYDEEYADGFRSMVRSGEVTEMWSPVYPLSEGKLCLDFTDEPDAEVGSVMPRMAEAFDLAYRRFKDLQNAEAQARKAEINLAVEKVRARAMAMHRSEEMADVAITMRNELQGLGVSGVSSSTVYTDQGEGRYRIWDMAEIQDVEDSLITLDFVFHPDDAKGDLYFNDILSAGGYSTFHYHGDRLRSIADWLAGYDPASAERMHRLLDDGDLPDLWISSYPVERGFLSVDTVEPPSEELATILPKMAEAFDLAYRRFEDLLRAEAQTREAQIEAAMERVRSRAIGMQTSNELKAVADELRNQMGLLGQKELEVCGFHLYDGDGDTFESWGAMRAPGDEGDVLQGTALFPRRGVTILEEIIARYESSESDYVVLNEGERAQEFFQMMSERAPEHFAVIQQTIAKMGGKAPRAFWSFADFSGGSILMVTYSEPDSASRELLRRCADVFDLGYRRFKDLRSAEKQAREEQIDAALERVRSHAMSMTTSDELLEVVLTIHRQFTGLGLPCEVFWHAKYLPDHYEKALTGVGGERVTTIMELPKDFSAVPELAAWERGTEKLGVFKFDADAAAEYLNHMIGKGKFLEVDPNAITEEMVRENHGWTFVQARTTHGELGYNLWGETEPSEEAKAVLLRFARVFDLAYRRYEDLRESEAAVREARIEAALERVRARTMGMHSSDELKEVAMMYAAQLDELGMDIHGAMFLLQDPDDEAWTLWTGYSQNYPLEHVRGKTFEFPFQEVEGDPSLDAWRRGETVMESFVSPDELPAWTETYRIVLDASDQTADDWIRLNPDGYFRIDAYMKYGVVAAGGPRSFTEEEIRIQVRFAREFERTYRRFLDLKKAEEQARESRIEAALERMRSRTMAMQASDELLDVSSVMTEQLVELGIDIHWAYLYLYNEEQDELEVYLTKSSTHPVPQARRGSGLWTYPRSFHDPGQGQDEFIAVWRKRDAFRTADWGKDRFDEWADQFQMMFDALGYSREDYRPHAPDGIFNVEALMGPGYVGMGGARPMDQDDIDVLVRFANEFEGTYRRFLDIKRAEAQARESQVEAALERVRGRAMAMQHSDELGDVVDVIFQELELSFQNQICIFINHDPSRNELEWWSTGMGAGVLLRSYKIPLLKKIRHHPMVRRYLKDLRDGTSYSVFELAGETKRSWDKMLFELTELANMPEETKRAMMSFDSVFLSDAYLTDGMLEIAGPAPLSTDQAEILQRFARVLEFSYSRMADLQKAEADYRALIEEKARTEKALSDLQATQKQLIEQEKLASLGSLTAGIAHEIKNPLNFVNNFAEVSEELMDELAAAVSAGDGEEAAALLDELRQNARQIAKHGGRADSIVRSMMQHARGGASEREAIDVNTFVEEYVDLAWHGMRARDHTFQCDVERTLDPDSGTIEGQPQEIGRVVLNLLNNAFYAIGMEGAADLPVVRVSTARANGQVAITVADSGPGIPEDIREKIFEPFFTTKPTGEGTGLGLSLSYDIVTKGHGGEMSVENEPGGGARFIVRLPE